MGIKVAVLICLAVLLLPVSGVSASDGSLRLVEAAKNKDTVTVRTLLMQHVDVNAAQPDGATALAWAAHWDDLETADLLIRAGANVNAANDYGVTPLSLACTNRNADMVAKLLNAGADPNAALVTGETALMTAARTGNVDVVISLLAHDADVNVKETRRGQTALMWAVAEGHIDVARALIDHGADVHARSKSGFTALLFATRQGGLEAVKILLGAGADANEATPDGASALIVASGSGHATLSMFLLEHGADPNAKDGNGVTALHYAVQRGNSNLLLNAVAVEKDAGLPYLLRPNMLGVVKALLAHGADPNARIAEAPPLLYSHGIHLVGATPFLLAAAEGDVSVMRALVAAGAKPLLATRDNTTPLMAAAGAGRFKYQIEPGEEKNALECAKLAVELGADVNAANEIGQTALHAAAYVGATTIIQFLVDKGAKLDAKDVVEQTPLSIAESRIPGGDYETGNEYAISPPQNRKLLVNKPIRARPEAAKLLRRLGGETAQVAIPPPQRPEAAPVNPGR